jgi:ABC-type branched-subunit amino acid transport system ATPase component
VALLELEEVGKAYGGLPAVDGVSVAADEGEILALVGPNGAGKSTLLKLVVGLESPTRGRVRLAGEDITGKAPHQVRRRGIAMVQQTPRPFPTMTVLENVTLGALFGRAGAHHEEEEALELAGEALSLVGLGDRRHHHVGTLNLHQLRFLELARAVAGQPRVLLLDEVMAGLNDAELETSMGMVRAIRDRHGITVVWVEHVMKAVMKLAQRVVVLNFGKILAEGAPEHVMRDPAVVEAYLGQEAGDA